MSSFFTRKYAGLSYAVNYLRTKNKTDIDTSVQEQRDAQSEKNTKLAQNQASQSTAERIASTVGVTSGGLTLSKSKTLFKALKNKFGSNFNT